MEAMRKGAVSRAEGGEAEEATEGAAGDEETTRAERRAATVTSDGLNGERTARSRCSEVAEEVGAEGIEGKERGWDGESIAKGTCVVLAPAAMKPTSRAR